MSATPRHGEVWWCEPEHIGRRPVVVLSRDAALTRLGRAMIAPCTTTIRHLPSEVSLEPGDDPVPQTCVINLDSVESVALGTLTDHLGSLSGIRMQQVCEALAVATDCG